MLNSAVSLKVCPHAARTVAFCMGNRYARRAGLNLQAQGVSQRQAAKQQLQVTGSTLQARRSWHDRLDICPEVARFFLSGPGRAFLYGPLVAVGDERVMAVSDVDRLRSRAKAASHCGAIWHQPPGRTSCHAAGPFASAPGWAIDTG